MGSSPTTGTTSEEANCTPLPPGRRKLRIRWLLLPFRNGSLTGDSRFGFTGALPFASCHRGLEPEGSWQGAGGALQPEAASAAAEVESHHRHQTNKIRTRSSLWEMGSDFVFSTAISFFLTLCRAVLNPSREALERKNHSNSAKRDRLSAAGRKRITRKGGVLCLIRRPASCLCRKIECEKACVFKGFRHQDSSAPCKSIGLSNITCWSMLKNAVICCWHCVMQTKL